jgi:hypothetical protein
MIVEIKSTPNQPILPIEEILTGEEKIFEESFGQQK